MERTSQRLSRVIFCISLLGGVLAGYSPAWAESSKVILVEEHWELSVAQPETDRSAPQTTMVMSPTNNLNGTHFLFTLNHVAAPDYAAGGMQVQHWDGEQLINSQASSEDSSLAHAEEVVTWVQRISLNDGHLAFQVRDGHSETWGEFGGDDLAVSHESSLNSLNQYRPSVSLSESQVNYAENRVSSLVLKKLVWVTENGQVHEQNAPIPLDTSLDDSESTP